ncbi:MAG: hypothetical protein HXY34_07755 [Candidatus Thorarchaeota archaeon]|nr:hypothetical protein [Candidatus Thorarchaeota archaeon]
MTEERERVITIFDRPRGVRFIGLTQMFFGFFGILAAIGVLYAWAVGVPDLAGVGPLYSLLILFGVGIPCIVIGNAVDDLRRTAVKAQIAYSAIAVLLTTMFLLFRGIGYHWRVPLFDFTLDVYIGNLAAAILVLQASFAAYLLVSWSKVVPPPGVRVERDRKKAREIRRRQLLFPQPPVLLAPDGVHETAEDEQRHILEVRRVTSTEGMAILCSNCGGATPVGKQLSGHDNTVICEYCGVRLAVGSVFVPCANHPDYLAATTCSVCGEHYCRRCLTAQSPPVDERWTGSVVFVCQKCFEGRYKPAVTTTSVVIPTEKLFQQAGARLSRVSRIYRRFLGM